MTDFSQRVLAFDYGTVRIGVAASRASLAEPLRVLANDESLWSQVVQLIAEEKPTALLVGISEADMAEKSKAFAHELERRSGLPVTLADETLSSHTVEQKLRALPLKKRRGAIDHYAAAEILQAWLDES